jgi:protein TIF31
LELYRDSKLQVWIEERVLEAREKIAAAAALEPAAGSVELELKDAATDNTTTPEPVQKAPPAIINAADYHLSFNPDAFIERKPLASGAAAPLIYDVDADSTKSVRDASVWLRTVALPEFIFDVVTVGLVFTDGLFLTKLLHRKGINMRYLGMLASMVETDGPTTDFGAETRKEDNTFALAAFKVSLCVSLPAITLLTSIRSQKTLQHEMVSRSSKHILNRLLRDASTYDHPSVIAHFCNCLLGTSLESHPLAELVDLPHGVSARRSWTSLTPSSLRAQLVSEVESRFRYALPVAFFDTVVPTKLLREICARVGIQLVLRNYNFGSSSSTVAVVSSSDEATKAEVSSETKTKKKKASSKSKKDVEVVERQLLSIRPEDVLNIVPVVKTTVHKVSRCDVSLAYLSDPAMSHRALSSTTTTPPVFEL